MRTPSPALIVASIALFVALGGTSYAVTQLPKNSVGTKQLKANAVTGAKVKNGSLAATDFSNAALDTLQGNTGPAGPTGATGATGPSNVFYGRQQSTVTVSSTTTGNLVGSISLPAGSYSVVAVLTADNGSTTLPATVSCGLTLGDRTAYQTMHLTPRNGTATVSPVQNMALAVANSPAAVSAVTVVCTTGVGQAAYDVYDMRIIATQTGALTTLAAN